MAQDTDLDRGVSREVWVAGLVFTGADEANDAPNSNELGASTFGVRERLSRVLTPDGTFSLTAIGGADRVWMQRATKGYDPNGTSAMIKVAHDDGIPLPVWLNYRDPDDLTYYASRFLGLWKVEPVPEDQGGPDDLVKVRFSGRCDAPDDLLAGFMRGRKVALVDGGTEYTGTLGEVPDAALETDDFVLAVYVGTGPVAGPVRIAKFAFSENSVDVTGAIAITKTRLARIDFTPAWAFVVLQNEADADGTWANDDISGATDSLWTTI